MPLPAYNGNLRRLSSSYFIMTLWESTCTQLATLVAFSGQKLAVCDNCIRNFVVSPNMWLVKKVTFSYMIKWTNAPIQEINNSLGLSLFDHYLFVMYCMPDSIIIDFRASDNSNVYFKSIKSWINLLNQSIPLKQTLVCTPIELVLVY